MKRLTPAQIREAAESHGIDPAALKAVLAVEAGGSGYLPDGTIKVRLERHWVYKRLKSRGINPLAFTVAHPDLCHRTWKVIGGTNEQWGRIREALGYASSLGDPELFEKYKHSIYEATSWGLPQLMGFHWQGLGFKSVYEFKHYMEASEANQLELMLRWMKKNGLLTRLQKKDWYGFAKGYNGPAKAKDYAAKLFNAYQDAR